MSDRSLGQHSTWGSSWYTEGMVSRRIVLLSSVVALCLPFVASAANFTSSNSGVWNDAYTWGLAPSGIGTNAHSGSGSDPGVFINPVGVVEDSQGNFYIGDPGNNRIQKYDHNGHFITMWGTSGTAEGQFDHPAVATVDANNNMYVIDENNARIQKFDSQGNFILMFGAGVDDGTDEFQVCTSGCQAGISGNDGPPHHFLNGYLRAIAINSQGDLVVFDQNDFYKFDTSGHYLSSISLSSPLFMANGITGFALDSEDNMYVTSYDNAFVEKLDPTGAFLRMWGWGVEDGSNEFQICTAAPCHIGIGGGGEGQFDLPGGIAVDSSGNVYVQELHSGSWLQKFDPSGNFLLRWQSGVGGIWANEYGRVYDVRWGDLTAVLFKSDPSGNPLPFYICGENHTCIEGTDYPTAGDSVAIGQDTTVTAPSGATTLSSLFIRSGGSLTHSDSDSLTATEGWAYEKVVSSGHQIAGLGMENGPDGFPRIIYQNENTNTLVYVRCTDADCSHFNDTVVATDVYIHDQGSELLALGSDGFARTLYRNKDDNTLSLIRCLDEDCTTKNVIPIESNGDAEPGEYGESIIMGNDDLPRVLYANCGTNYDVHFVRFTDANTPGVNTNLTNAGVDMECSPYNELSSIALGPDGFPRFVYEDGADSKFKLGRCTNADCTSPVITSVQSDTTNDPGYYGSVIRIGSDGFPRIAYVDGNEPYGLHYALCTDADCTNPTLTDLTDTDADTHVNFGLALRSGDLASMQYEDTGGFLHLLNCTNTSCSAYSDINLGVAHGLSGGSSVTLDSSNLPQALYSDENTGLFYARFRTGTVFDDTPTPEPTPTHHSHSSQTLSSTQLAQIFGPPTPVFQPPTASSTAQPFSSFTLYLTLGSRNDQVLLLQKYLNTHGFIVAQAGAGSSGQETNYFGFLTKAAVIRYQKAHLITPAIGNVGPLTRAALNAGK